MTRDEQKQYYKKICGELYCFVNTDKRGRISVNLCPKRSKWLLRERCMYQVTTGKPNVSGYDLKKIELENKNGWKTITSNIPKKEKINERKKRSSHRKHDESAQVQRVRRTTKKGRLSHRGNNKPSGKLAAACR